MNSFKKMNDKYLKEMYVPDVYQESIFNIDYDRLKNAGVKLISFDIDDTLEPIENSEPSEETANLFEKLKLNGFELYIVSNANFDRVSLFSEKLGVEGVARAEKPYTTGFTKVQNMYFEKTGSRINPNEMAHIGNSITKDVVSGNKYGIVTCLVRDMGLLPHFFRIVNPIDTKGQKVRRVLFKRGIWRKHHLKAPKDQYYQLNETQIKYDK